MFDNLFESVNKRVNENDSINTDEIKGRMEQFVQGHPGCSAQDIVDFILEVDDNVDDTMNDQLLSIAKQLVEGKNPDWNKDKEETQIKKLTEADKKHQPERQRDDRNVSISREDIERFAIIIDEIEALTNEAFKLIPRGTIESERARSYWYGQLLSALGVGGYERGSMHSMSKTLEELDDMDVEEDEDADDTNESKKKTVNENRGEDSDIIAMIVENLCDAAHDNEDDSIDMETIMTTIADFDQDILEEVTKRLKSLKIKINESKKKTREGKNPDWNKDKEETQIKKLNEGHRSGAWIVGSLRGQNIDELWANDDDMVMVIIGNKDGRNIGLIGSGKAESYGPVGKEVIVDIDSMQGGPNTYRPLGDPFEKWTIKAYAPVSKEEARKNKCRALYYFD